MKIKITEIEANANELRASQTLASSFNNALRFAFTNTSTRMEYEEEDEDDQETDDE